MEALERLKAGNKTYLTAAVNPGNVSPAIRRETAENGQHPYAIVIACSDSRVVPEDIFSCGIGELFTIRVAGNVIGEAELGSIQYAAEHLGVELAVMLGHTGCGAVGAALEGQTGGHVGFLTGAILRAIGEESDPVQASIRNAEAQAQIIRDALPDLNVVCALYHVDTGTVDWW